MKKFDVSGVIDSMAKLVVEDEDAERMDIEWSRKHGMPDPEERFLGLSPLEIYNLKLQDIIEVAAAQPKGPLRHSKVKRTQYEIDEMVLEIGAEIADMCGGKRPFQTDAITTIATKIPKAMITAALRATEIKNPEHPESYFLAIMREDGKSIGVRI